MRQPPSPDPDRWVEQSTLTNDQFAALDAIIHDKGRENAAAAKRPEAVHFFQKNPIDQEQKKLDKFPRIYDNIFIIFVMQ